VRSRLGPGSAGRRVRDLLFFACLGAGFILVEVAMIQKCVLFLGHPVYALAVVLSAILVFSGLGSRLSERLAPSDPSSTLKKVLAAAGLLVALYVFAVLPLLDQGLHWTRDLRIAVNTAVLLPLGVVLGMPMTLGIRLLAARDPRVIPWAWGVNGAASVLGTVAGMVVALVAGFDQALLAGAALYLLAIGAVGPAAGGEAARARAAAAVPEEVLSS
jgi:hypothetical protein